MSIDLQALYPRLINLMLDTVFVVDTNNHIAFVSDAREALLGYRAVELIGTPITNYMHPEDLEATKASIVRIMSGQPHSDFRNRYIRKDGGSYTSCGRPNGPKRWERVSGWRGT